MPSGKSLRGDPRGTAAPRISRTVCARRKSRGARVALWSFRARHDGPEKRIEFEVELDSITW